MTGPWLYDAVSMMTGLWTSLLEYMEAVVVLLAVGASRGWRSALTGAVLGLVFLAILIPLFGPASLRVSIPVLQRVVGGCLLLFGLSCLRKGVLWIFREDRTEEGRDLKADIIKRMGGFGASSRLNRMAVLMSLKIVLLEGGEVIFIIWTIGACRHNFGPVAFGSGLALLFTLVTVGVLICYGMRAIPQNGLTLATGILLSSFGTFWLGQGFKLVDPGDNGLLIVLIGLYMMLASFSACTVRLFTPPRYERRDG